MRLGIVIPWFGRELKGGAEQQAWQIASRLAKRGHDIEVLTTCSRSHQDDWSTNHLPAGVTREKEGFTVRRFPVDPRDRPAFDSVCQTLLATPASALIPGVLPIDKQRSQVFVDELIKSTALHQFLVGHKTSFDAFILLPYLYGPVIHGVEAVRDRACLQPCLHDEAYAYLSEVADAFFKARFVFFNSEGEAELAARLYGPAVVAKSVVVGEGVEVDLGEVNSDTIGAEPRERFVLYLGRKEPGKNSDMLARAYRRFRRVRPNSKLRLVFAGYGSVDASATTDGISDEGLVSEGRKAELLRDCLALAQPSINESYSRVVMEAWRFGKPVAVNRECLATSIEVRRADGGWLAGDEDEWAAWFVELDRADPGKLRELGQNGLHHSQQVSDWERVMVRYETALQQVVDPIAPKEVRRGRERIAINQFLPNLSYGDAISNHALWIRNQLRSLGYKSDIYVRYIDPRVAHECHVFSEEALRASDGVIYHHSIGTEITPSIARFQGPKCLIYHNITPAEFVEPYRPAFAGILRAGRAELPQLAPHFDVSVGDSTHNAEELLQTGFPHPGVLPICVDGRKWTFQPDAARMRELTDGRTNIVFVGRIAANKKQDDLLRAFKHYKALDPDARLFLVGTVEHADPYATHVQHTMESLGLGDSVRITGSIPDAELAAYYRTAHLFWSMSEHEGFCVPLIEAMWFDVPILAYRSTAIPETLGNAALMFTDKSDLAYIAALAASLTQNKEVRQKCIRAQRRERDRFRPERVRPILESTVHRMLERELNPA